MKMDQFFTRQTAGEGVSKPIPYPDGTPSEAIVTIIGTDSDRFRSAAKEHNRRRVEIRKIKDPEAQQDADRDSSLRMMACLVDNWSLEDPRTDDNVVQMFKDAPHFLQFVDDESADRSNFFTKPLKNS